MRVLALFTALAIIAMAQPGRAIVVTGTNDAALLADTLFLGQPGVRVSSASLGFGGRATSAGGFETVTPSDFQAGTFTNFSGTYGIPTPGVVLSSGFVRHYGSGADTDRAFSSGDSLAASAEQNALLSTISNPTGRANAPAHYDPVQLTVKFDVDETVDTLSFVAVFGSEEFPHFQSSRFNDAFGMFLNGVQVAGVLPTGGEPGDALLPVNIRHPDMKAIAGTELNGVLAPNGVPLLRFDVPVVPGSVGNVFSVVIADTGATTRPNGAKVATHDSTIFLAKFGDFSRADGASEFTPLLPSNPQDPVTGAFEFELAFGDLTGTTPTIWIDPPVSVGYVYEVDGASFASVTAPSLLAINDPDGYSIVVDGQIVALLPPAGTFFFDTPVTKFTLEGIDPALMLDPASSAAFPLGIQLTNLQRSTVDVRQTPLTIDYTPPPSAVPLPGGFGPLALALLASAALLRRRGAGSGRPGS